MPHSPRDYVTRNALAGLRKIRVEDNTLLGQLDNAAQTLVYPLLPSYGETVKKLMAITGQNEEAAVGAMKGFYQYHTKILSMTNPKVQNIAPLQSKKEMRQFYSLVYHLLPENDEGRRAIERAFGELGMEGPIGKNEIFGAVPEIMSFTSPKPISPGGRGV